MTIKDKDMAQFRKRSSRRTEEDFSPFAWRTSHLLYELNDEYEPRDLSEKQYVMLARHIDAGFRVHYSFLRDLYNLMKGLSEMHEMWAEALGYLLIDISPIEYHKGGWVYFIQSGDFVKIGLSSDVEARLKQLQTSSPYPMTVLRKFPVPNPVLAEFRLHRHFADRRRAGEWFALTPEDIDYVLELDAKDILWLGEGEDKPSEPEPVEPVPGDDNPAVVSEAVS